MGSSAQQHLPGLRDHGHVAGLEFAARRRKKHAKGEAAGERNAEPLQEDEQPAQAPLQRRRYTRDHAAENWFAALFHDL
jgi:hypothetical protein